MVQFAAFLFQSSRQKVARPFWRTLEMKGKKKFLRYSKQNQFDIPFLLAAV
jgi:hypothetical protein